MRIEDRDESGRGRRAADRRGPPDAAAAALPCFTSGALDTTCTAPLTVTVPVATLTSTELSVHAVRQRDGLRLVVHDDGQPRLGAPDARGWFAGLARRLHRQLAGAPIAAGPDRLRHVARFEFDPYAGADRRHREEARCRPAIGNAWLRPAGRNLAKHGRNEGLQPAEAASGRCCP